MLITGEGGAADPTLGAAYLELASEAGDAYAARILEAIGPELAEQVDRRKVDSLKSDWVARHGRPD